MASADDHVRTGGQTRPGDRQWFFQGGVELKPNMALGSVEAIKLVGVGLGCAILPAVALQGGDRGRLVVRRLSPRLYRKLAISCAATQGSSAGASRNGPGFARAGRWTGQVVQSSFHC